MSNKLIHIVAFDVPYPPNYGGAIDVYYKIKALHECGCKIVLHCFDYGRGKASALEAMCEQVYYYPRQTGLRGLSLNTPYIVNSRKNSLLSQRLAEANAPILFEGVHTLASLPPHLNVPVVLRAHNVEHEYYNELYRNTRHPIAKLFFAIESRLLKRYENNLPPLTAITPLSAADTDYFARLYSDLRCICIPPFHAHNEVIGEASSGNYVLYHGNLSHPENIKSALFILQHIAPHIAYKVYIAGSNPAKAIVDLAKKYHNTTLITNPKAHEMDSLIANAHLHLLPTFQQTGMKLKLLHALYAGRHVIVNPPMLHGTTLHDACTIATDAPAMITAINTLMPQNYTPQHIALRKQLLLPYRNSRNAEALMKILFK
ncbi:MAG: glycosyltransferase [Chitinophagia bacterium]|nr:glycosyltransferase [Chitinophagia bacterium]